MASFTKLQRQFSVRKNSTAKTCTHTGGETYSSNGLKLKCCAGSGGPCKLKEIDYLTSHLVQKCDEIDELKARIVQLESRTTNKTVNITVNNTYNILAAKGVDILKVAWQGGKDGPGLYRVALMCLEQSAPSEESNRLIRLANSGDVFDRLTFQQEVIDSVDQVLPQLPERLRKEADAHLDKLATETNQEAIKNGIEVE